MSDSIIKPEILYVFDPLCGWCYGFSGVLPELIPEYSEKLNFSIVSGGMVRKQNAQPIGKMSAYILSVLPRLEQMTGVKFGPSYIALLQDGRSIWSSEKPTLALEAMRLLRPNSAIQFAHDLQKKLFLEGKSLEEDSTYKELAREYGIAEEDFLLTLKSEETNRKMLEGFDYVSRLGISGFPAVVGIKNNQYFLLSNGYTSKGDLKNTIEKFLQ